MVFTVKPWLIVFDLVTQPTLDEIFPAFVPECQGGEFMSEVSKAVGLLN